MDADLIEMVLGFIFLIGWPLVRYLAEQSKKKNQTEQDELNELSSASELDFATDHKHEQLPDELAEQLFEHEPEQQIVVSAERSAWIDEASGEARQLLERANKLSADARHERPTHRFVKPLEDFVVAGARNTAMDLRRAQPSEVQVRASLDTLWLVLGKIERFMRQRLNPKTVGKVGDADALAVACYQPLVDFARARGLKLTSTIPVTDFGAYDLATWTGFIPTGLAPLSLPKDFFRRIAWWPALAHEIAHDFLAATEGLSEGLRTQLGLPDEMTGRWPLRFELEGLAEGELYRICGGWFEELFCDVIGIMMVGPAYAWAMVELFPSPGDPSAIVRVGRDEAGVMYDAHPPRHLRLVLATYLLDKLGLEEVAQEVRQEWGRLHGGWPPSVLFPVGHQWVGVPIEAIAGLVIYVGDQLYEQPLEALGGYRLRDVPGIDFGIHAKAESARVTKEILAGQVPHLTNPRWVIAGATQAWHEAPHLQKEIIRLVRRGLRAVGTFEHAPQARRAKAVVHDDAIDAREAFLLHEIMSPPLALRRAGRGGFMTPPML